MNIVKMRTETAVGKKTLMEVTNSGETAFVGQCGYGPEHTLYLIGYGCIIQADHPSTTWSKSDCTIYVDHYVDVEIKEVPK